MPTGWPQTFISTTILLVLVVVLPASPGLALKPSPSRSPSALRSPNSHVIAYPFDGAEHPIIEADQPEEFPERLNPLGQERSGQEFGGQCLAPMQSPGEGLGRPKPRDDPISAHLSVMMQEQERHLTVQWDPTNSTRRQFNARLVAIFSCLNRWRQSGDLTLDMRFARPAIELAILRAHEMFPQLSFDIVYRSHQHVCKHQQAIGHAADEFYRGGASLVLGPGCSESLASLGQLASYWDVPVCSTGYLPEVVTQRFNPLTLMQVSISVQSVGEFLLELCARYNWRHLVIVWDDRDPLHSSIRDGLMEYFSTLYKASDSSTSVAANAASQRVVSSTPARNNQDFRPISEAANGDQNNPSSFSYASGSDSDSEATSFRHQQRPHQGYQVKTPWKINATDIKLIYNSAQLVDHEAVMLNAAQNSRIMLLLTPGDTINGLLDAAHAHNMTRGQFVFIAHELFEVNSADRKASAATGTTLKGQSNSNNSQGSDQHKFLLNDKIQIKSHLLTNQSAPSNESLAGANQPQSDKQHHATSGDLRSPGESIYGKQDQQEQQSDLYRPFWIISLRIPTGEAFMSFRKHVAAESQRMYNYTMQLNGTSRYALSVAALIYDCVMLYASRANYIVAQTSEPKVTGSRVFQLAAGKTFDGALTGALTINKAGQRVIDFTLNQYSPQKDEMRPIAHFAAIDRKLRFVPGELPHWELRNKSAPASDPKCRPNPRDEGAQDFKFGTQFCDADAQAAAEILAIANSQSFRLYLGFWLLLAGMPLVALFAAVAGYLVHRKLRTESQLLNLWWSIKYDDIQFEEPNELGAGGGGGASGGPNPSTGANQGVQSLAPGGVAGGCDPLGSHGGSNGGAPGSGLDTKHSMTSLAMSASDSYAPDANHQHGKVTSGSDTNLNMISSKGSKLRRQMRKQSASGAQADHHQAGANNEGLGASLGRDEQHCVSASSLCVGASAKSAQNHAHNQLQALSISISGAPSKMSGLSSGSGTKNNRRSPNQRRRKGSEEAGASNSKTGSRQNGHQRGAKTSALGQQQQQQAKLKLGAILGASAGKLTPGAPLGSKRSETRIGLYKASRVAVKRVNLRSVQVNRQLLVELRQVRDLTHDNLVKFIGLCAEESNVCLVSELCSRGNLSDLLQNQAIRLDWPFRFSIISDLVDGLQHLHASPIGHHGRLKSPNCVIDSRFVVKLTDFGLPTLKAAVEMYASGGGNGGPNHTCSMDEEQPELDPRQLLWTAPEHLRTRRPLLAGSQKGDVYSLAIIFQEVITRCGPFECEPVLRVAPATAAGPPHSQLPPAFAGLPGFVAPVGVPYGGPQVVQHKQRLEPAEIVNLVRMGLSPPFRPYFAPEAILAHAAGDPLPPAPPPSSFTAGATALATQASGQQHPSNHNQHHLQLHLHQHHSQSGHGHQEPSKLAAPAASDVRISELVALVRSCWLEAPERRPTVAAIRQQLRKTRRQWHLEGATLMDNLLQRMERYTDNLESLVEQKTAELMEEKQRSEQLLYEMLPSFVVDQLRWGHQVAPEAFEAVTICFSDIKDFTSIAARSSPIEVVNLLNGLYTAFDDCIARYDVYKVETIGDAYMVVSGLPVRNGDLHASEIANMALEMLELIGKFEIVHLPEVKLELRIGIHSGPCASGVVGTKMFRYCLFGDTVNTASRMESHGEPMKVHISEDSANILAKFDQFIIEPRGLIDIKGKGIMKTYWLLGKLHSSSSDDNDDDEDDDEDDNGQSNVQASGHRLVPLK